MDETTRGSTWDRWIHLMHRPAISTYCSKTERLVFRTQVATRAHTHTPHASLQASNGTGDHTHARTKKHACRKKLTHPREREEKTEGRCRACSPLFWAWNGRRTLVMDLNGQNYARINPYRWIHLMHHTIIVPNQSSSCSLDILHAPTTTGMNQREEEI
jgi:hypothetical protein